jgi:hypothetical protein
VVLVQSLGNFGLEIQNGFPTSRARGNFLGVSISLHNQSIFQNIPQGVYFFKYSLIFPNNFISLPKTINMYKRKYINPEIDLSESIIKRSSGVDPEANIDKNVPNLHFLGNIKRRLKNSEDEIRIDKNFIPMAELGMS